jgi:hypothetical protein
MALSGLWLNLIFNINNIKQDAWLITGGNNEEGRLGYGFENKHERSFIVSSESFRKHYEAS